MPNGDGDFGSRFGCRVLLFSNRIHDIRHPPVFFLRIYKLFCFQLQHPHVTHQQQPSSRKMSQSAALREQLETLRKQRLQMEQSRQVEEAQKGKDEARKRAEIAELQRQLSEAEVAAIGHQLHKEAPADTGMELFFLTSYAV